jgi:hypothetical protein
MATPTIKLIDTTSDLSAQPISADCDSRFAGTCSSRFRSGLEEWS